MLRRLYVEAYELVKLRGGDLLLLELLPEEVVALLCLHVPGVAAAEEAGLVVPSCRGGLGGRGGQGWERGGGSPAGLCPPWAVAEARPFG
jgi:hypothetical protein